MPNRFLPLLAALVLTVSSCSDANLSDGGGGTDGVKLVRTTYGIPHITANNFYGLGLGYGYAYSEDNYCVLMKEVVRANGESALYLGDDGSLSDDFVYRFYNTDDYIQNEFTPSAPEELQDLVDGYAAGMNRYLADTGAGALAEGPEGCRDAAWVRDVTPFDLAKVFRKLILRGSTGPLAPAIIAATPPSQSTAKAGERAPQSFEFAATDIGLPPPTEMGSNAYGIGSNASQTGYGILLGNPHFPWQGPERFYIAHLTIPDVYDVMGASLHGVPVINIGFNEDLAWSHTVSTARRFGFFELQILEDDPMRYRYDGEIRQIEAHPVSAEITLDDGTVETRTETIYMSHFGPIVDIGSINEIVGGWPTAFGTVLAVADANLFNTQALSQWLEIGKSKSIAELKTALGLLGVPWVNTIAADRAGTAYYADIGSVPHISADKIATCGNTPLTFILTSQGFPSLDGSRSECEWGTDPNTREGIFSPENLPSLETKSYVANSNDSYWLSNPNQLLENFSPVIGRERVQQSLRTRQAFVQVEDRLAGTDGLGAPGFTVAHVQELLYGNRNIGGELIRADVLSICEGVEDWTPYAGNPAEAAQACAVLGSWDGRFNTTSVGPHIWQEFWSEVSGVANLWAVPFDANDSVNTPRELNVGDAAVVEEVKASLGAAVDELVDDRGLPMDRPWGQVQYRTDGDERIPIHGGSGASMFSVISSRYVDDQGLGTIRAGNSYIHAVTWDESECPDAYAVLTYSQSTDPASPHYADMTRVYSAEEWVDMPYCADDIEAEKISETTLQP
ncbi:MAG: penicillin acylase family protein [Candidatus Binatia bacterium]|nr:penicillin acylase family protein [Candidatus Binatia bacterium]